MTIMFSPTLTASSSTSRHIDIDPVPELDAPMDFSDLLNLSEFEDSSVSHSPTTISPNHTPSPLLASQSPYAMPMSPTFDFLDPSTDFSFDFLAEKPLPEAGPSTMTNDLLNIKQEPVEFGWPDELSASASQSASQSPVASKEMQAPVVEQVPQMNLAGLPIDQQAALQQLMANIVNYQQRFGLELPAPTPAPAQTVQPSMVFSAVPTTSATTSAAPSYIPSSVVSSAPPQPSPIVQKTMHVDHEDEPLQSIEPHEDPSRARAESTFSLGLGDDLDFKIDSLTPLPAIFSAGKGKGGKKGGGMSSVVRGDDEDLDDDDSWRPSPEEYKKLSSKEKRQLRNKLSARAFRTRRKDYIGTLEAHIKDRDSVIDAIRAELVSSRTENQDLRRELASIKADTMSVLHPESADKSSESPALISALAMSPALPPVQRKSATPAINTRKDLPSSPALSTRGFWGGNDNLLGGGGSTICHTMFTPDLVLPPTAATPLRSLPDLPRANINPQLNDVDNRATPLASVANGKDISSTFAEWSETNAFSLRSMDSYRMQLWSRLAREAQAEKSGLSSELRPKFFVDNTPTPSPAEASTAAQFATLAASHISTKLASSFWSAFAGPSSKLDTDKLTAVVTGRARLHVVSDEKAAAAEDDLVAALGGLRLQSGVGRPAVINVRENPLGAISSFFKHASALPARA